MKYIAKIDTWFDAGTEAILIDDYEHKLPFGLFEGWRTCDNPPSENRKFGERYRDQEDCGFDEFDEVEDGSIFWGDNPDFDIAPKDLFKI